MSMPDVFLPLLFKVSLRRYTPLAQNDLGNEVEAWADPVEKEVYGWGPPQLQGSKEVLVGTTRYVVAVELMVPPDVFAKDNDRIQLGSLTEVSAAPNNFEWYRVVGPTEDYSHNPFGWNPGNVINLIAVKGAKL
jgi:hypothetical protein